jgi:predicted transposase YbfD/YdcC
MRVHRVKSPKLAKERGKYSMNQLNYTTLIGKLADLPDPRNPRGQRYEWLMILTLICGALLSGHKSVRGMAQWAFLHGREILDLLQPQRRIVPSASTLYRTLRALDVEALELRLSNYSAVIDGDDSIMGAVQGPQQESVRGQAIDGKEVRGAGKQGAPLTLVSLVRHESAVVLGQQAVDQKSNEITVVPALLAGRDLRGTVTTMDALLTQHEIAQQILDQGRDYLMVVKRNQPTLFEAIEVLFDSPPIPASADEYLRYTYANPGHGRIETRSLESSTALNDYLKWPGIAQVLRRTRRSLEVKTGEISEHVTYAITSLVRTQARPQQLEALWRAHWTIENRLHYVRDVSMGEDGSTLRTGNAPHALAALRNAILTLLRYEGWSTIPDAFRYFAASVHKSLQIIGALET